MKALFLGLLLGLSATAVAESVRTAEYYRLDAWIGEYPDGFEMLADLTVSSVTTPLDPVPGPACTLRAKTVIHPWAQKTKSEFVTLYPISRYVANKDYAIERYQDSPLQVKKGEEVILLSYLSEGICLFNVRGMEVGDSCFMGEPDDRANLVSMSPFGVRRFFKTACKEGYETWIDGDELNEWTKMEDPAVKAAEIIDYGTVKEP
ncbi:MAG: hypothetical protein AB7G93_22380 [Bdellovibrionales bacterium]